MCFEICIWTVAWNIWRGFEIETKVFWELEEGTLVFIQVSSKVTLNVIEIN